MILAASVYWKFYLRDGSLAQNFGALRGHGKLPEQIFSDRILLRGICFRVPRHYHER